MEILSLLILIGLIFLVILSIMWLILPILLLKRFKILIELLTELERTNRTMAESNIEILNKYNN